MEKQNKMDLKQELNNLIAELDGFTWKEEDRPFAEEMIQKLKKMARQYGSELREMEKKIALLEELEKSLSKMIGR